MSDWTRRTFLKGSAAAAAGAAFSMKRSTAAWAGANDRIRVAVIGLRGRGGSHLSGFANLPNVEVAAMCDVDESVLADRVKYMVETVKVKEPKRVVDMREIFDDKSIDAVSIATPNHWHSLAGIWACQAGKHVYVEKPCSHNISEGRRLVEAARKYDRIVQHGTQSRTNPGIKEGIEHLRNGIIGEVYMAKGLCYKWRNTIGKKPDAPVPAGVHYDLWQGPAADRPFNENRFHYNWHWNWEYGNGDIGNQGVHEMDMARWGLGVGLPTKVTAMGNHFMFDDDQETPNCLLTSYFFPNEGKKGKMLIFEVRHWHTNGEGELRNSGDNVVGSLFYGPEGYLELTASGYRTYLGRKREPGPGREETGDAFGNFIDAVRARDKSVLNAEIEEGHLSSSLCHLGNISYRLGRQLEFDPATEKFVGDEEANAMLTRDYRAPYVVPTAV